MKRIILTGEPGCGKSKLAKLITQGAKTLEVNPWNMSDELKRMDPETQWILVDGVSPHSSALKNLIEAHFIKTRKPYARTTNDIPVPNIIIVWQSEMSYDVLRDRFQGFDIFRLGIHL